MKKMAIASLLAFAASTLPAFAAYPDKVVKIVAPYGAGGGVDTFTRPIAVQLSLQTGQQFVVDNRAGAGGTIGVQAVARAPADGYTILSGGVHQPMAEGLYPQRGYDMVKDFVPLTLTAVVPNVLVVHPRLPVNTVAELIAYAKANPEKLSYCSSGSGTSQHIIAEMFKAATKTSLLHVPHKGTAAAMTTLISGQCDMMFDGLGTSAQQITGGRLKALALTSAKRSPYYPAIATMQEAGGPAMDVGTWYGWWVLASTPKDVVERLRTEITRALGSTAVKDAWKAQGAEVPVMGAEQVESYVRAEFARWMRETKNANIAAE